MPAVPWVFHLLWNGCRYLLRARVWLGELGRTQRALGGRIPHLQGADSGNDDLIRLGLLLKSKIGI